MSIVERAINKRRAQVSTAPNSQPFRKPAPESVSSSREENSLEAIGASAIDIGVPGRPKAQIEVDLERLRSIEAIPPAHASGRVTDEFRRIKWPLLRPLLAVEPDGTPASGREIMVTSSVPEEGKTFVTLNLALSIAHEKDCAVLLVDADVAKPKMTRIFEAQDRRGLTDL